LTGFRAGQVSTPSGGVGSGTGEVATVNDRAAVVAVNSGPDNDTTMVVAAKLLWGDVAGGVAAGVTFDNPPETNVSNTNVNLEVANDVRGWALAMFTV